MKSGTADLPLHYGRVPRWLADRMARLGREIVRIMVEERGSAEFLSRLSDPFWFQALGCVLGMDWHSSGITTSVMGALKKGLNPLSDELGIFICGGRGRFSRKTPEEIRAVSFREGLNGDSLVNASCLSAKVDNTCLQDGFQIYLHNFILARSGEWAVVQQGMNDKAGMARRYHWHSPAVRSFVRNPHTGISGKNQGLLINLSDQKAEGAQGAILNFASLRPEQQNRELQQLFLPDRHDVRAEDVDSKRLGAVLAVAAEAGVRDFPGLLLTNGLGPRTLQSLALVSEVIYGEPVRFEDPARFSFAHGGKDGHPFPVPLKIYDQTLSLLCRSVQKSRVEEEAKREGLKKLHRLQLFVESLDRVEADPEAVIARERKDSHRYGGRTVGGAAIPQGPRQLTLF